MKYQFECCDCGAVFNEPFLYLCPVCSAHNTPGTPPAGVLKTVYPYSEIRRGRQASHLFDELLLQKFLPLLPIRQVESLGLLRVGNTPLYEVHALAGARKDIRVLVKDDAQNPTFSFKDRASVLVSAWAKEQGIDTIVAASTGNAGSSLAGICAAQGQQAVILAPASAPPAKLLQMVMYGARTILVDGNYDAAFDLSIRITERLGWFNRNTAFNPFTIEGKKTVAYELYRQTCGHLPDYIFVPVGDGVILSGVYKGFEDLLMLGIIHAVPVIVAVQSIDSDNLVRNYQSPEFVMKPATTLADSISVDVPRNFNMAVGFLAKYQGITLTVSDAQIIAAAGTLARCAGIFTEPAGAAAVAGFLKLLDSGFFAPNASVAILATGSGLKDVRTPLNHITLPKPVGTDVDLLIQHLTKNL